MLHHTTAAPLTHSCHSRHVSLLRLTTKVTLSSTASRPFNLLSLIEPRCISSSPSNDGGDSNDKLSPSQAGQRAFELRSRLEQERNNTFGQLKGDDDGKFCKNNGHSIVSMSTLLSHAGLQHDVASAGVNANTNFGDNGRQHYGNLNAPLSPPIELSTTYERPPDGDYEMNGGLIYSRGGNPTRSLLEDVMGRLEMSPSHHSFDSAAFPDYATTAGPDADSTCGRNFGHAPTRAFSSGMAAIASLLLAHTSPIKLLIPSDVYHGVPTLLHEALEQHFVEYEAIDMTMASEGGANIVRQRIEDSLDELLKNKRPSSERYSNSSGSLIIWIETPSNPLCQVTDIRTVCDIVNEIRDRRNEELSGLRITTCVDSTWAPPCITQPLLLGADAVLHSGTKYLGGHSDVLLGLVSTSPLTPTGQWLSSRLSSIQSSVGAVASPLESWLTLRGLRTLHLRLERQCQSAMEIAQFLDGHEGVIKCHYPGLDSHPQHEVAKRQMIACFSSNTTINYSNDWSTQKKNVNGTTKTRTTTAKKHPMYGGMLSFELPNESMAMAVAGAVRTIRRATSLGGTETLIEHRASIEPPERTVSPPGLLRLSVGLEDVEDLKRDLDVALMVASRVCCGPKQ